MHNRHQSRLTQNSIHKLTPAPRKGKLTRKTTDIAGPAHHREGEEGSANTYK